MIHDSVLSCVGGTPIVRLSRLFPQPDVEVLAKLEFLNPGGSVKDRSARFIIEQGLSDGTLHQGTHILESSSGNFGIALAMVCRVHRLPLTIVVDPNILPSNYKLLRQYGAAIEMVDEPDPNGGGYLEQRLSRVRSLTRTIPGAVWIDQYANELTVQAHEETGEEILRAVPGPIDHLVAAVSTTGTMRGIARSLRGRNPGLRVVAVDAVGSVIFGGAPSPRLLPGFGANRVPELLRREDVDEVAYADDEQALQGCRELLEREAISAGGSSGAVIHAVTGLLPRLRGPSRVVIVLPDRGERYLDLTYPGSPHNDVLAEPPGGAR